jgi:hypothetical protein
VDDNVNPDDVLLQLDRIEYLQKLRHIEMHASHYTPEIVELYRTVGRVHLDEPKYIYLH